MSKEQERWLRKAIEAGLDKKEIARLGTYLEGETVNEECEKLKALVFDPEFDSEEEDLSDSAEEEDAEGDESDEN